MARITVEDSSILIPNRFELVMVAAQRVRQILAGAELHVERDDDKNTVVALREIAENKINIPEAIEQMVKGKQLFLHSDDFDEDIADIMNVETAGSWIGYDTSSAEEHQTSVADDNISEEDEASFQEEEGDGDVGTISEGYSQEAD